MPLTPLKTNVHFVSCQSVNRHKSHLLENIAPHLGDYHSRLVHQTLCYDRVLAALPWDFPLLAKNQFLFQLDTHPAPFSQSALHPLLASSSSPFRFRIHMIVWSMGALGLKGPDGSMLLESDPHAVIWIPMQYTRIVYLAYIIPCWQETRDRH